MVQWNHSLKPNIPFQFLMSWYIPLFRLLIIIALLKGISQHLHILHHISLDVIKLIQSINLNLIPGASLYIRLHVLEFMQQSEAYNWVKQWVKKYGTVISNCVDRCKLTYFLLCAQAYFHTNMPIICHKRPRKSTRVGWRVISLPWMDRDL